MAKTNKVFLIGVLGDAIKIKNFENGNLVGNASLATTYSYKNKNNEKVNETEWHSLIFFNKSAEIIEKYTEKGSKLYVEGRLRYRTYEKDGKKHSVTEIHVSEFEFLSTAKTTNNSEHSVKHDNSEYSVKNDNSELPF